MDQLSPGDIPRNKSHISSEFSSLTLTKVFSEPCKTFMERPQVDELNKFGDDSVFQQGGDRLWVHRMKQLLHNDTTDEQVQSI